MNAYENQEEASQNLVQLAEQLKEPGDYFHGVPAAALIRPTQILCYTRSTAERLLASNRSDRDIHHRHVLILPLRGSGSVTVGKRTLPLAEKQALLVFPFQFHHYSQLSESRITWLFITFECANETALAPLRRPAQVSLDEVAERRLRDLLQDYRSKTGPTSVAVHLELLLAQLVANAQTYQQSTDRGSAHQSPDESLLDEVNSWAMERIDQRFSLGDLSRSIGYSESHLRALFREKTGHSIGRHIRRLRLLKACQLLQGSNLSVSEIAARCAFDSLYSFSRAFRRTFLTPPSGYRKKMRSYAAELR